MPLLLADLLFGRPGWVISYRTNWRIAPRWGLLTWATVTRDRHHRPTRA